MFQIREFRPEDQNEARLLIEAGLGEHFGFVDPSRNPDLDDIHASFVGSGGRFFVAVSDGVIVGTTGLVFHESTAQLVRVSTHPAFRRQGVASALLKVCIDVARTARCRRLVVHTQPEWADSLGFYRRHGFTQFGRDDTDVHLGLDLESACHSELST